MACQGVTKRILIPAWKKLWSEAVTERDFKGFRPEQGVLEKIVYLGKSMSLEVVEGDTKELVTAQSDE